MDLHLIIVGVEGKANKQTLMCLISASPIATGSRIK